jgi:putative DNA primase/helicase
MDESGDAANVNPAGGGKPNGSAKHLDPPGVQVDELLQAEAPDHDVLFAHLSRLNELDYHRRRRLVASKLGLNVDVLDHEVHLRRKARADAERDAAVGQDDVLEDLFREDDLVLDAAVDALAERDDVILRSVYVRRFASRLRIPVNVLEAAVAEKRMALEVLRRAQDRKRAQQQYATATAADADEIHETDLGNARRFVDQHGNDTRYCPQLGCWLIWDGMRWSEDVGQAELMSRARQTISSIYAEAANSAEKSVLLAQHAIKSESRRSIEAMLALAQKTAPIVVDAVKLDAPKLFNCLTGTIDLATCALREHRREDMITRLAEVGYRSDAKSELWNTFLARTLPDETLRRYVQKAVGATLYGRHGMKVVFVIHGRSNTGKGTFQTAISTAIGEYAMTAEIEVLRGAGKNDAGDAPRPGIVRLKPARMVNIYETSATLRINAGLLKTLSGDDPITARDLHKPPITFLPQFTIWLATNYRPHVPHDDRAAWGRLREVPFVVELRENERDTNVRGSLRDDPSHRAGVLAWIIEGTRLWLSEGLETPEAVESATRSFRDEMDPLVGFIDACCNVGEQLWVPTKELRSEYEKYCEENAIDPVKGKAWKTGLESRGLTYDFRGPKNRRVRVWTGVGLNAEEEGEARGECV